MLEQSCNLVFSDVILMSSQENKCLREVSGYGIIHTQKIIRADAH
jgi:hypothetical protein